ncbi:MAG: hypothetical protein PVG78_00185 [Desulfobacterales bacterium]|jgi:hypothetical protein
MLRWFFIVVYLILAGYLAGRGIAAYQVPDAALDAGVAAIFCAFWFFFGAAGFYLRHVWLVTIANVALLAVASLFLFLAAVNLSSRGGGAPPIPWATSRAALGLFGFLFAGQIYAVVLARRGRGGGGPEQTGSPKSSMRKENR